MTKLATALAVALLLLAGGATQATATRVRADCHVVSVKTITETRDLIVQRTAAGSVGREQYRFITARTLLCDDGYHTTIRLGLWRAYQGSPPSPTPIPMTPIP